MEDTISRVRPLEEIAVAHNFLAMLVTDKKMLAQIGMDDEGRRETRVALCVLCWVLQHDNPEFVDNMDRLSRAVQAAIEKEEAEAAAG